MKKAYAIIVELDSGSECWRVVIIICCSDITLFALTIQYIQVNCLFCAQFHCSYRIQFILVIAYYFSLFLSILCFFWLFLTLILFHFWFCCFFIKISHSNSIYTFSKWFLFTHIHLCFHNSKANIKSSMSAHI